MPSRQPRSGGADTHYVRVAGEWPLARGEEQFEFSFLMRRVGVPLRPGQPLRTPVEPHILALVQSVIEAFLLRAMEDGYVMRMDVARRAAAQEPWPRWALTTGQARELVRQLTHCAHLDGLYPISMWLVPAGDARGERLIALSRTLPHDEGVFDDTLRSGVVRLSLFDAFCDILGAAADGERVLAWLQAAVTPPTPTRIEMAIRPGTDE